MSNKKWSFPYGTEKKFTTSIQDEFTKVGGWGVKDGSTGVKSYKGEKGETTNKLDRWYNFIESHNSQMNKFSSKSYKVTKNIEFTPKHHHHQNHQMISWIRYLMSVH